MKRNLGLTLTELMVVVSIISFLALIAFWALRTQVFKGYDSRRKTDMYQIKVAVEEYEKDHDCYPLPSLVVCGSTGLRPYLETVPCDPRTKASYYYDHEDATCPKWYRIYTTLENLKDKNYLGPLGPDGSYNYYSGSPNAPKPGVTSGQDFYGCFSGSCVNIQWDQNRPGPECDPNYGSPSCYGQCTDPNTGQPDNDCQPWQ